LWQPADDGDAEGEVVGLIDGLDEGEGVLGEADGELVGLALGEIEGLAVGVIVGKASVSDQHAGLFSISSAFFRPSQKVVTTFLHAADAWSAAQSSCVQGDPSLISNHLPHLVL
jgi:hypothetical protein